MTRLMFLPWLLLCALALRAEPTGLTPEQEIQRSAPFLHAHPDLRHRRAGLEAWERGDAALAFRKFLRAARFGDKPSQAMLAEMHWRGEGTPRDRAAAYAWMDLAAERRQRIFVLKREQYWHALTPGERGAALEIGRRIYAAYGDDVAQPRLERKLRQAKHERTGSLVGFVGPLTILLNVDGTRVRVRGEDYYRDEYWEPERYWRWSDAEFEARGSVDVGPLSPTAAD